MPSIGDSMRGWDDVLRRKAASRPVSIDPARAPFVVLDDARRPGAVFILQQPTRVIEAWRLSEVSFCLEQAREALREGKLVAGFVSYEAGAAFEPRLAARLEISDAEPLVWFGCFDEMFRIEDFAASLPPPQSPPGIPVAQWTRESHAAATRRVLDLIHAGDIYQANLTFSASVPVGENPLANYAALRTRQEAGWGGMVFTGRLWLLSFSPELFFSLERGRLEARPMKGTAARARGPAADRSRIEALRSSSKERAENLMIVDLLRNDFSRIALPGSVKVPELFAVESYPTIHQMTSRISAQLVPGRDAIDVFEACFPCGSVTGAPKLRAMEILADIETGPRGSYTGSMGVLLPDGNAAFNVMIRTMAASTTSDHATLKVGSGITVGSMADAEWIECLDKLRFVRK